MVFTYHLHMLWVFWLTEHIMHMHEKYYVEMRLSTMKWLKDWHFRVSCISSHGHFGIDVKHFMDVWPSCMIIPCLIHMRFNFCDWHAVGRVMWMGSVKTVDAYNYWWVLVMDSAPTTTLWSSHPSLFQSLVVMVLLYFSQLFDMRQLVHMHDIFSVLLYSSWFNA